MIINYVFAEFANEVEATAAEISIIASSATDHNHGSLVQ
jgi:hypothetical protein